MCCIKTKVEPGKQSRGFLRDFIDTLKQLVTAFEQHNQILSASRFSFSLELELPNQGDNQMPIYEDDRPDFTFPVRIPYTDSEGVAIADGPIPPGGSLTIESDRPEVFSVALNNADPKLVSAHVGGPNADTTPADAVVTATLFDAAGAVLFAKSKTVTVTVGAPKTPTDVDFDLPE